MKYFINVLVFVVVFSLAESGRAFFRDYYVETPIAMTAHYPGPDCPCDMCVERGHPQGCKCDLCSDGE